LQYIHPSIHPANGISPTRRRPLKPRSDGISPTRRRLRHPSIHSHAPLMGFSSLRGGNVIPPLLGFPSLEGSCLYTPLMGFLPLESVNAVCLRAFLGNPKGAKPSVIGLPPLGVPCSAKRFSPLRAPVYCFANGITPTRNTDTS